MADPSTAFIPAFQNLIVPLFQTDPISLREAVRSRVITGKSDHWERIGGTSLQQVTSRHQNTPYTPSVLSRRRLTLNDWAGSERLDKLDEVKMMIDPRNEMTQNLLMAWRRVVASTLVTAFNASSVSVSNVEATTSVSLPSSQVISNGGTGFTVAKLRQVNRILDNAGVPRDGQRHILVSAFAIEDLMADSQVTSADYSSMNALMNGGAGLINTGTFMGFQWHMISDAVPDDTAVLTGGTAAPILPKSGNIRTCYAWHKSAMGLSIGKEATVEVDRLPEHLNLWQVLVQGSLGATRILDAGVVTVDIDESV
jgi:hypothetical protein